MSGHVHFASCHVCRAESAIRIPQALHLPPSRLTLIEAVDCQPLTSLAHFVRSMTLKRGQTSNLWHIYHINDCVERSAEKGQLDHAGAPLMSYMAHNCQISTKHASAMYTGRSGAPSGAALSQLRASLLGRYIPVHTTYACLTVLRCFAGRSDVDSEVKSSEFACCMFDRDMVDPDLVAFMHLSQAASGQPFCRWSTRSQREQ